MNKNDKTECRKMIRGLLKTFNFEYLWMSNKTAVKKCMEFVIDQCGKLNNKDYTLILETIITRNEISYAVYKTRY